MNLSKLKPVFWTDQQTGEPIGPFYSWNDIREMQLDDFMSGMRQESSSSKAVKQVKSNWSSPIVVQQ